MKRFLALAILILAAASGWYWWQSREEASSGELELLGNVDIRQISLAFDGTGRVLDLRVEEGDRVTAGQVLGRVDTRTLELQAAEAEARAEAQRQALRALREGSRPEEIDAARAQLAAAEAGARRADLDLTRATRLLETTSSAISQQSVDLARSEADTARASVDQMRAALRLAEAGPRAEDIAGAAAELEAAEAALALLRHQIAEGELRAPTDAVVRSRLLEPGDMASPGSPALALALTSPKWARVYVNEPDLGRVRTGMRAQVFTDSAPEQPVEGTVGYISSVAEFTPKSVQTEELRTSLVYEVRVMVEDAADALRLGQPVTVRLPVEAPPS